MSEKTLEELESEYRELLTQRINKVKTEMSRSSKLEDDNRPYNNLSNNRGFEEFKENFQNKMQKKGFDVRGRSYQDILESLSNR
jgi:hypothetical protein